MSFLDKLFGDTSHKDTPENAFQWNDLTELKQLDALSELSFTQPVLIFKHSTRCGISRSALKNFERGYTTATAALYFLDLLEHRDVSNAIADRFGVMHQSPQLILLKNGTAVYNTSHDGIDAVTTEKIINQQPLS